MATDLSMYRYFMPLTPVGGTFSQLKPRRFKPYDG